MTLELVVIEEGCEVEGVMYVVSEVYDNDGCCEVEMNYVNGEDMEEWMKRYDSKVEVREP
jgi:hypothetical protein